VIAPLVAVTTGLNPAGRSRQGASVFLYTAYLAALEAAGLTPVLLTPAHSADSVRTLIDACHGLLLTGGADIDPAHYGAAPSDALGSVSAERDEMEFRALAGAIGRSLPVFAICRGLQTLNVHLGGTLYQDQPTERPGSVRHTQRAAWNTKTHTVHVLEGSRLLEIAGTSAFATNSFHHQAVRALAPGLRAVAQSEDGVIEAAEGTDGGWMIGVQWHPERQGAEAPASDPDVRLFAAFGAAVRDRMSGMEDPAMDAAPRRPRLVP
jgi:putative glutamine amidotransferase